MQRAAAGHLSRKSIVVLRIYQRWYLHVWLQQVQNFQIKPGLLKFSRTAKWRANSVAREVAAFLSHESYWGVRSTQHSNLRSSQPLRAVYRRLCASTRSREMTMLSPRTKLFNELFLLQRTGQNFPRSARILLHNTVVLNFMNSTLIFKQTLWPSTSQHGYFVGITSTVYSPTPLELLLSDYPSFSCAGTYSSSSSQF